ncbi:MAG: fused MFS/spermidine synthase [Patescibacteria group bacterium]|jgi:spermidine synthase
MLKEKFKIGRLEIIVFIAGTVVMILELIGSRILAPYLGNSIFVWASLIGVILGALSLGYYLGGHFSANNPKLKFLAAIIFAAGLSILIITLIKDLVLFSAIELGVKTGSILATLILFTVPSVLLGMVSPYALRLKIEKIENSGGVAGNLYALSTIGSIAGTFLAGFYLIPTFGSTQILFGLSAVLIITALLGGGKKTKAIALILVIIIWSLNQLVPSQFVFEGDSAYNHIIVKDTIDKNNEEVRILYLATESHSGVYKNPNELYASYHQFYRLDTLFKPKIEKALTLGGGAYVAPRDFLKRFPKALMTVVEIDPKVTEVAKQYFWLQDNPRLKIDHQDGRIFLNNNREKFDVIYGDAFSSYYSIPFQLTTKEAAEKIYNSLTDDGIFILNIIAALDGDKAKLFQAEYKTLQSVFPQLYLFPTRYYNGENQGKYQNLVLIATKNQTRLTKQELVKEATSKQKELLEHLWEGPLELDPSLPILTDNFAPVDYYISKLL